MEKMKTIITVYALLFLSVLHSEIVINEFLAGSETCCGADIFDGNTEDFVELYNNGAESININGLEVISSNSNLISNNKSLEFNANALVFIHEIRN